MKFSKRVVVYSSSDAVIYFVHRERAQAMVRAGLAKRIDSKAVIIRNGTFFHQRRPLTPPTLTQYMGQRYTFRQRLQNAAGETDSQCISLKRIDPRDAHLFRLSVTDCLSQRA